MTCRRIAGAIVCGRGAGRKRSARARASEPCRWPDCSRNASQARWGCREHYFKLPPAIRRGLWQAERDETAAQGAPGRAWAILDQQALAWIAEQQAKPPRAPWRQPELPL